MSEQDSESFDNATPADQYKTRRRKKPITVPDDDKLPPFSDEAEKCVLSCILLSPNEVIPECIDAIKSSDVFYDLRHLTIYDTMIALYDRNDPVDTITVYEELKKQDMIDQVGGLAYISALTDFSPSSASISYYLEIIVEKHTLRKVLAAAYDISNRAQNFKGTIEEFRDEVNRDIEKATETNRVSAILKISEHVKGAINILENSFNRQGELTGIASGFADLDKMTNGFQNGDMIVIAARPSMGKTALAMNIAETVGIDLKLPVGVFSLEMTGESLALRMICSRARVNLRNIQSGFIADRDFPKITGAAGKLANSQIYIDDTAGLNMQQLKAKARRMQALYGIKLFIIDYMQLLQVLKRRNNRREEIDEISGGIKALAKQLGVPIIALSQLNREIEKESGRKPRLSDLRESGTIEQDADLIGMLYKPKTKEDEEEDQYSDAIAVNLLIAKQRNGPTGDVNLTFLRSLTRFESAAKIQDDDIPQQGNLPIPD